MRATKTCPRCETTKPIDDFGNDSRRKDKRRVYCRKCNSSAGNPSGELLKDRNLRKRYGITLTEYNSMLEEQDYCCAICKVNQKHCDKSLAVDHCHKTDKVRKLLCQHCNIGLGQFRDNIEFLTAAIEYLEEHE